MAPMVLTPNGSTRTRVFSRTTIVIAMVAGLTLTTLWWMSSSLMGHSRYGALGRHEDGKMTVSDDDRIHDSSEDDYSEEKLRAARMSISDEEEAADESKPSSFVASNKGNKKSATERRSDEVERELAKNFKFPRMRKRELRVICLMIKNERTFLKDWIDFHLLAGWNRFVIYDHGSTDNVTEILREYPRGLIDYHVLTWQPALTRILRHSYAQVWVYQHCFQKYWWDAQVLANFDVDEYVFPGAEHMDEPDPFLAAITAMDAYKPGYRVAVGARVNFFFFGLNGHLTAPTKDAVAQYTRRAPELPRELKSTFISPEMKEACENATFHHGYNTTERLWQYGMCRYHIKPYMDKLLHFPNDQISPIAPDIHISFGKKERLDWTTSRRTYGMTANHLWIRSYEQIQRKGFKNTNDRYKVLASLPIDHPVYKYYELIEDKQVVDFLRQARKKVDLQSPKFLAKMERLAKIRLLEYPVRKWHRHYLSDEATEGSKIEPVDLSKKAL